MIVPVHKMRVEVPVTLGNDVECSLYASIEDGKVIEVNYGLTDYLKQWSPKLEGALIEFAREIQAAVQQTTKTEEVTDG